MAKNISGAQIVARVLKEEGVECTFTVYGGEMSFPFLNELGELGITMYHMRSERGAGYAADAYARSRRRPGVCFCGGSPGFTDMVSPICNAYSSFSPVIAIISQHAAAEDKLHTFQEAYANEIFKSITKWTHLVSDWHMITYWVRKAFRDVMTFPLGPVVLVFPNNVALWREEEDRQLRTATGPVLGKTPGDPRLVEKAVEMLLNAERPLAIAGEGLYFSDAIDELKEFVELMQMPVHTRRIARGAVSEHHPLVFTGGSRQPLLDRADVILLIGLQASYLEDWFEPPVWDHEAKYIQIHEAAGMFFVTPPTEIGIVSCPKLVLRQMIDYAKSLLKGNRPPKRIAWLDFLKQVRETHDKALRKRAESVWDVKPVDPEILGQEIVDFLNTNYPDATIIYDSVTLAHAITDRVKARFAGQIIDYPLHQPVGHGVAAAVGVQVARPGRPVIVLMGDGGMGIGGWDVETLRRYNLPSVIVVYNNSAWGAKIIPWIPKANFSRLTEGVRYDKIFELVGCHGEHVEEVKQIRPALYRAFNSGKPAVINVVGEVAPRPPAEMASFFARIAGWTIWSLANRDQLDEETLEALRRISPRMFKRILLSFRSMGLWISEEELAEVLGISLEKLKGDE